MEIEQKERERIEALIGQKWKEVNYQLHNSGGVNPTAFRLGFLSANTHLQKEVIQPMQSVMIAAAEEIQRCWPAHCDAEGYGPANLMHRLEKGIPSQYGYTAGAFAKLEAEIKALREKIKSVESLREKCKRIADQTSNSFGGNPRREVYEELTEILKNEG